MQKSSYPAKRNHWNMEGGGGGKKEHFKADGESREKDNKTGRDKKKWNRESGGRGATK